MFRWDGKEGGGREGGKRRICARRSTARAREETCWSVLSSYIGGVSGGEKERERERERESIFHLRPALTVMLLSPLLHFLLLFLLLLQGLPFENENMSRKK